MAIIVPRSQTGTQCWSPARFCGGECARLTICKLVCKRTCKAHKTTVVKIKKLIMADGREVYDENSLLLSQPTPIGSSGPQ
jgi:hypothetical protein